MFCRACSRRHTSTIWRQCRPACHQLSFGFYSLVNERKFFTASATASAVLPRPQRQLPRHTFHIVFPEFPRHCFLSFCFRDHSATAFSKVSGCGWFNFLSFWPFGHSFAFILTFWAFISYHFRLLGLHFLSFWPFSFVTFVCLGLGHFLRASAGSKYRCLGMFGHAMESLFTNALIVIVTYKVTYLGPTYGIRKFICIFISSYRCFFRRFLHGNELSFSQSFFRHASKITLFCESFFECLAKKAVWICKLWNGKSFASPVSFLHTLANGFFHKRRLGIFSTVPPGEIFSSSAERRQTIWADHCLFRRTNWSL